MFVFVVLLIVALAEVAGVASILPFIAVVSNPGLVESNDYIRWVYEELGFQSTQSFLLFLGCFVFFMLVSSLAVKAAGFWLQVKFSNARNHSLGYRLMRAYLYQPYEFFLHKHTSAMTATVLSEASQVVNGALFPAMQVIANGLVVLALIGLLVLADPKLALITACALGIAYGGVYILIRQYMSRIGKRRQAANRARFNVVQEVLGGAKDILLGGLETTSLERFRLRSSLLAHLLTRSKLVGEMPSFAMQGLVYGGMMAIILYLMVTHGGLQEALPVLSLYAFAGYRLMPSLQALYKNMAELRFSGPTLVSLHGELLELEARIGNLPSQREVMPPLRDRLELKGVTFGYSRGTTPALRGVNLTFPAQSMTGIVGSTGSGKTTLIDVVLGLLAPAEGELRLDGKPITRENVRSWQAMLGYVPQQIFLIDNTVTANIAFGIPEEQVDHAAVERAARVANLHDFVVGELSDGYRTRVGERGVRLSGGQRQRIGIARALYHDPQVLILDEATSALDNVTERAVMDAVNNLGGKKTIIMIAHRLSTVKNCDQIVLMEKGVVAGIGTYEELVAGNAAFREMAGASH